MVIPKKTIAQGDVITYVTEKLGMGNAETGEKYGEIIGRTLDEGKISDIKSGKLSHKVQKAEVDKFFKNLILPIIKDQTQEEMTGRLDELERFLYENGLVFEGYERRVGDTYESYVKRMLSTGLINRGENWNNRKTKKKKGTDPLLEEKPTIQIIEPTIHPRNNVRPESFTGRTVLLAQMHKMLQEQFAVVLCGIGGIGKTSLWEQYAFQHRDEYKFTQSVTFQGKQDSVASMIAAIPFDNLDEKEWDEDEKFRRKLELLQRMDETTLLVFDNVDDCPDDKDILGILRRSSRIHIIVTTRLNNVFDNNVTINVGALDETEQLDLFSHHFRLPIEKDELEGIKSILHYVEGHTLLIELIAKSMFILDMPAQEMLLRLHKGEDSVLPNVRIKKDHVTKQGKIWELVRRMLFGLTESEEISEPLLFPADQREVMRQLTLLPTEGVSSRLLLRYLMNDYAGSLRSLAEKSWVQEENKHRTIRLHPIIREVVKTELTPSYTNCNVLLNNICRILDGNNESDYENDLCTLVHSAVNELSVQNGFSDNNLIQILKMAEYCRKKYRYQFALSICQRALAICNGNYELSSESLIHLHTLTGQLYQRLAKYSEAICEFEAVLSYQADETVSKGKTYRKLGEVYRKASLYEEALKYDNRALEMFDGHDNRDIAEAKNAIGVVYLNLANAENNPHKRKEYLELAKTQYEDALEMRKHYQVTRDDLEQLAFSYHNVGTAYKNLGNYELAEQYHRNALAIREQHHLLRTNIAASYAWLGNDYLALGDYQQAREMIDNSLTIRKEILGEMHPDYAWSLDSLSQWYEAMGNLEEAEKTEQIVIQIRVAALGKNHKYTQTANQRLQHIQSKREL